MEGPNSSFIILMADDDEDDCVLVEAAFREMRIDHDLRFVDDGRELLDYLYHEGNFTDTEKYPRPHLILLDLNMPKIDGREVLKIIKSDPQLRDMPVLILTTSKEKEDIELSKQAGASAFLSKPEVFEDLTEKLEKFCTAILRNPNIPFEVIGC